MKRIWLGLLLSLLPVCVFAMPNVEEIEKEIQNVEFSRALAIMEENNYMSLWESDVKDLATDLILAQKKQFLMLLSCLLLYALMHAFSGGNKSAGFLGRLVVSAICLEHVAEEITIATDFVQQIAGLIQVLLPSLCVLTAASGGSFRAMSVQTVGLICGEVGAAIIAGWVIPLAVFSFAASVFHSVGEISLQKVAQLFSSLGKWVLGLVLSLSVAALAICGFASGVKDSMAMKTAKFLTSSMIPVAGAALSQAAESVAASAGLLRGTIGTAGLIAVVIYLIKPIVRLLVVMLSYRLLSAAADVLCPDKQAGVFSAAADTFAFLIGCVSAMGVMAFLSISVLLGGVT